MTATLTYLKWDSASGDWKADGPPVEYDDDPTREAADKARAQGERWVAQDPHRHTYEVERF